MQFADWAESKENAGPAAELRNLLLKSICSVKKSGPIIRVLDAGCGSGRDIAAFESAKVPEYTIEASGFDVC